MYKPIWRKWARSEHCKRSAITQTPFLEWDLNSFIREHFRPTVTSIKMHYRMCLLA